MLFPRSVYTVIIDTIILREYPYTRNTRIFTMGNHGIVFTIIITKIEQGTNMKARRNGWFIGFIVSFLPYKERYVKETDFNFFEPYKNSIKLKKHQEKLSNFVRSIDIL